MGATKVLWEYIGKTDSRVNTWSKGVFLALVFWGVFLFGFFFGRYSYICIVCKKSLLINWEIAAFSSARPCRQVQADTSKLCSHAELPRLCKPLSGRCRVMLMWHHAQNNIPCLSAVLISLGSCSYLASGLRPSGVWQAKCTGRVLLPFWPPPCTYTFMSLHVVTFCWEMDC